MFNAAGTQVLAQGAVYRLKPSVMTCPERNQLLHLREATEDPHELCTESRSTRPCEQQYGFRLEQRALGAIYSLIKDLVRVQKRRIRKRVERCLVESKNFKTGGRNGHLYPQVREWRSKMRMCSRNACRSVMPAM